MRVTSNTDPQFTTYYGGGRLLVLASRLTLDCSAFPTRRPTASIVLARDQPFQLDVGKGPAFTARAVLIAPDVERRCLVAGDGGLAIFDIPIHSREFGLLASSMAHIEVIELDHTRFTALMPTLERGVGGGLDCTQVDALLAAAVAASSNTDSQPWILDARIVYAMQLMESRPFSRITLPLLAEQLNLSPRRVSHLFRQETGCTYSQYRRWSAVWMAIGLLGSERSFTEIAHSAGFYDLAHFDRAFREVFGFSLSAAVNPDRVHLCPCPMWNSSPP